MRLPTRCGKQCVQGVLGCTTVPHGLAVQHALQLCDARVAAVFRRELVDTASALMTA